MRELAEKIVTIVNEEPSDYDAIDEIIDVLNDWQESQSKQHKEPKYLDVFPV